MPDKKEQILNLLIKETEISYNKGAASAFAIMIKLLKSYRDMGGFNPDLVIKVIEQSAVRFVGEDYEDAIAMLKKQSENEQ